MIINRTGIIDYSIQFGTNYFLIIKSILHTIMLLSGLFFLYIVITNFPSMWFYIPLAAIYSATIFDTFKHRIIVHKLCDINPESFAFKILIFLLFVSFERPSFGHIYHHIYPDQYGDPENFRIPHKWSYFHPFTYYAQTSRNFSWTEQTQIEQQYKWLTNSKWIAFCNTYNIYIIFAVMGLLYTMSPLLFMFYGLTVVYSFLYSIGNIFAHTKHVPFNYRNHNTNDLSYNCPLYMILSFFTLGVALHNNHHANTQESSYAEKWFEVDPSWYIGRYLIKPLVEKK